jgi:hypothetical protein
MFYVQASRTRSFMPGAIAADWGPRIWYIEVGDDQQAVRFVEKFNDGKCLRYDRDHWCDDYGMLLGLRFSLKQKWKKFLPEATLIGKAEFEAQWDAAKASPLWEHQVATSRVEKWGTHSSQKSD